MSNNCNVAIKQTRIRKLSKKQEWKLTPAHLYISNIITVVLGQFKFGLKVPKLEIF